MDILIIGGSSALKASGLKAPSIPMDEGLRQHVEGLLAR